MSITDKGGTSRITTCFALSLLHDGTLCICISKTSHLTVRRFYASIRARNQHLRPNLLQSSTCGDTYRYAPTECYAALITLTPYENSRLKVNIPRLGLTRAQDGPQIAPKWSQERLLERKGGSSICSRILRVLAPRRPPKRPQDRSQEASRRHRSAVKLSKISSLPRSI